MAYTKDLPETTDYTSMEGWQLLKACGDNAWNWAHAFEQNVVKRGRAVDVETCISWFANIIEHSCDTRMGTGPTVLPDGSAFFVAEVATTPTGATDAQS